MENSSRDGNPRSPYLRNLYAGHEATVKTGHGTTDSFQIGKGEHQGSILSPYLFNFYAEYITRNARLDEAQAGIKISGRNINNLRYADNMASGPITSRQIDGETVETVRDFIFGDSKILQMVTAAMKLKGTFSLGDKL